MSLDALNSNVEAKKQWFESLWENWQQDLTGWLRRDALKLLLILLVAYFFLRILRALAKRLETYSHHQATPGGLRSQQMRTLASVVRSVGTVLIYFFALLEALPLFGVDIKPLLASAGILGVAVGFGAQTMVKDVINGFFILIENQYDLGDVVRIGGVSGTVEAMSLRRTTLRDASGVVHVVPNGEIKVASNLTREWSQAALTVTVDVKEPSERIFKLLRECCGQLFQDAEYKPLLLAEPELVGLERIHGRDAEYLVTAKTRPGQQWKVGRELRRRIKEHLLRSGIEGASPARVYLAEPGSGDGPQG